MKKSLHILFSTLLIGILAIPTAAQTKQGKVKGHSTNPDVYFLEIDQVPNSLELLPGPPDAASIAFLYDQARYNWGKSLRNTPRGEQAVQDARVDGQHLPDSFSEAFGININPQDTPEIYKLIVGMREDAGDLATRAAKDHYNRTRPYSFYGENTCNPEQQAELSTNGSYPSGHTSIGWATALVLAEINPQRQNEILKRGYELGESRVICGYHWQSDVDAARIVGSAVVATLHTNPAFQQQLQKAKDEFAKRQK